MWPVGLNFRTLKESCLRPPLHTDTNPWHSSSCRRCHTDYDTLLNTNSPDSVQLHRIFLCTACGCSCSVPYVTVSEKSGHSAQNVHSSYKWLSVQRLTRGGGGKFQAIVPRITIWYLSFLPAQEWEHYVLYTGRHALSNTQRSSRPSMTLSVYEAINRTSVNYNILLVYRNQSKCCRTAIPCIFLQTVVFYWPTCHLS